MLILIILIWAAIGGMLFYIALNPPIHTAKQEIIVKVIEEQPKKSIIQPIIKTSIEKAKDKYTSEISESVMRASKKYKIPEYVIFAIISTESCRYGIDELNEENISIVNPRARSSYDCIGLMQISGYALNDYNNFYGTKYKEEDLYDIEKNIDIGTWHYIRYKKEGLSYEDLYIIYNVGYSEYHKNNVYSFYDMNGIWINNKPNSFFYKNDFLPPKTNNRGLCGKNKLDSYNSRKRFQKCLKICMELFFS